MGRDDPVNLEVITTDSTTIVAVGVERTTAASHGRHLSSFGPNASGSKAHRTSIINDDGFAR